MGAHHDLPRFDGSHSGQTAAEPAPTSELSHHTMPRACTSVTPRMYSDGKSWPLGQVTAALRRQHRRRRRARLQEQALPRLQARRARRAGATEATSTS